MGTRFVATTESPVHQAMKDQIGANTERDTVIKFHKFCNSARVARNSVSEEILEISSRDGTTFADIAHLASGVRGRERVLAGGDVEDGMWWAGQAQGLIHEVASCRVVVHTIAATPGGSPSSASLASSSTELRARTNERSRTTARPRPYEVVISAW